MELDELQNKVQNEFLLIKVSKTYIPEKAAKEIKNAGCLMAPFASLFASFTKRQMEKEQSKRNHDIYEIEADELLKNSELKKEICSSLLLITKDEILTEERFINYITAILYENKIRTKFVVPSEPALYAHIAYKIFDAGISNFCSENE